MAAISKINPEDVRMARKNGFKRKAPKKPKLTSSLTTLESWIARHNQYAKDVKKQAADYKKAKKLKDAIRNA